MSLQHFGKGALRIAENYTKYSDIQAKVRNATSNDPWGPSETQMNEIAQLTYNQNDFVEIMEMLDKRLHDKGKNWRHVFKSLTVLDFLLHGGSENVVLYFRDNIYIIKALKEFQYVDEFGRDCGANVRQKAKDISNLLSDQARLKEERRTRATMCDRMIRGHNSGQGEDDEGRGRKSYAPPPGMPPRRNRGADRDEEELRKAIEASKRSLADEQVRVAEELNLAAAIRLPEKEEAKRHKAIEDSTPAARLDDQPQISSPNGSSGNNPFPFIDPTPYATGLQPQQTFQPQYTMQPQFTSFNPYQQQAQQEAIQAEYLRQQQEWLRQQQEAQAQQLAQQAAQDEWFRQQQLQAHLQPQHTFQPHDTRPRQPYATSSAVASAIQNVVHAQLENTPRRLLHTFTGYLCDRQTQINVFETCTEYQELLSSMTKRADLRTEHIEKVVETYFCYVMLSHRWEVKEPLLHDIQDKDVYKLNAVGGIAKVQSFCKTARDAGYRWAWVDTCCIDQTNNVEVQQSVNSMFAWYRHAALTMVYLSDVPPSSRSGALARSVWNKRGWTLQEFLAPRVVIFYQKDWKLYLDDRSPNHKESPVIMEELGGATGINTRALVAFHPGMRGAREKLQWVSMRTTTMPEDIAYSLFGIFDVNLTVIYGEKKQNALGRLLQAVVAQSGDITALDWIGKPSEFNSCLPADIISYGTPSCTLPSLSEDEMQTLVSFLQDTVDVEPALRLYHTLNHLTAPRFTDRRLHLPCIVFPVTELRRRRSESQQPHSTFAVKAEGLEDLLITTEDKLTQFSRARPARQSFLLVRPWDRSLLELPDFASLPELSDMESEIDLSPPVSPSQDSLGDSPEETVPVDSESHSRALRLMVRLGQRFSAFLLAQQWGVEYKRIACDQHIIAQVQDIRSIHDKMDIRTLEIL